MADQARHGCSITMRQTDNATPVRLSQAELDKLQAKCKEKGLPFAATEPGVYSVHPDLMESVKSIIGDRPLV